MKKRILLVEPDFPYPNRSKNRANEIHKNFAPIGLLKLGAYHKSLGDQVKLVRGILNKKELENFIPDEILVTSLFTYWSEYVWKTIEYYRILFPKVIIKLGGIYATLHKNNPKFIEKAKKFKIIVYSGIHKEAEKFIPDYSLLNSKLDHHITHAMRGCIRRCAFCGTWKIEPKLRYKNSEQLIKELKEAGKNRVIFFDNNFLANPNIKQILKSLAELRINNKPVIFESQSGFDGRLLEKDPELAFLLKKARFKEIRLAWDNGLEEHDSIKKQIHYFVKAGYSSKEMYVFIIYNFNIPYETLLHKLNYCKKWKIQIADCRYRPLSVTFDNYKSYATKKEQTKSDYYINEDGGWTNGKIRSFRRKVRRHNLEVRYGHGKYSYEIERWSAIHNTYKFFNLGVPPMMEDIKKNKNLQKTIKVLNILKNKYKLQNFEPPDLSSYSKREIKNYLSGSLINNYPFLQPI